MSDEQHDSVVVFNQKPFKSFSFVTTVPPNTPIFEQKFVQNIPLSSDNFNYISRMVVRVDTTGIYNIIFQETFNLGNIPTTVEPGYYSLVDLSNLASVIIPSSGPDAWIAEATNSLQFQANSQLAYLLGFESFGTSFIPPGTKATTTINQTGGLDLLTISNSLISPATGFGKNFVTAVQVIISSDASRPSISSVERMEVPIVVTDVQTITWTLTNADGRAYLVNAPVIIFTEISVLQRNTNPPHRQPYD